MGRPVSISSQQILKAARALFLRTGFTEATTAEIARAAGVSEGSLFKHFRDKADLFCSAMELRFPEFIDQFPARAGEGDPRENLERFALAFLSFFEEFLPKLRMLWSHRHAVGWTEREPPPARALHRVSDYFAGELKHGRFRKDAHPEVAARLMLGGLWNYVFLQVVARQTGGMRKEEYVRELIDTLWRGVEPRPRSR